MDINDPRRRLQVLNQSNPSIRIATAPQPQVQINTAPTRTPNLYVQGSSQPITQSSSASTYSAPTPPKQSGWGGFLHGAANVGKSIVHPFAEFGNAALHVPQAVYREVQNKPIDDIQKNVFGTTDSGQIAKKIIGDTAQIGLTIAAPGAGSGESLAARAGIDAGIGAGYGTADAFSKNESLPNIAKNAAIGGVLGGVFAPVAKVAGRLAQPITDRFGSVSEKIAKETSAEAITRRFGVPEEAAQFLAKESNPETVRAVMDQVSANASGVPITDWVQSPKLTGKQAEGNVPSNAEIAPGVFDPSNPPQSYLPPGMHAPGAPDPVEVLSKQVAETKTEQEFKQAYNKLTGEDKAVADSALNGKTPEEFYNAVKGVAKEAPTTEAGTVLHLPQHGVHAKLTPEQAAILADETKNIPFTPGDMPHLTAGDQVLNRTKEVSQEEIGNLSPNAKTALDNAKKAIDEAGTKAKPSGEAVATDLPPEDIAAIKSAGGEVPGTGSSAPATKGDIAPTSPATSDVSAKTSEVATPQNAESGGAVDQVLGKLDEASKSYNPEAKTFSKQRGAALFRGADAAQAEGGLAGHYEQLKALKGIKKQTGFQPIEVAPDVRDAVMTQIHNSSLLPGEKLSANTGMLKVFGHIDGAPTPSEIKLIRSALGNDVADSIEQNLHLAGMTTKEKIAMVAATPKAAMATADISAPLRQGGVLGTRFPKQFAENTAEAVKFFGSPKHFDEAMAQIKSRSNWETYNKMGLSVDAAEGVTGTEEQFMTSILQTDAAKKVLVGHVASASDRAYSGFLTKFRADVADKILADTKAAGVELDDKALKSLGKFINTASGRGDLGQLEKHAGLLSKALFSPRLWKSRLDLLNPVYYARLDPVARKYAIQTSASFAGVAGTILSLASAAGATVVWDPRSADFAKIKVGNTRYDILGGLQQNIRLGAQMITGEKIDSTTGEVATLGPDRGFGKPSRKDLLYQFFENKENPLLGYAGKVLEGTDPTGQPINKLTEGAKLLIPLNAQDIYATVKDTGSVKKGVGMGLPGIFGVGVQTYGNVASKDKGANGEYTGKVEPNMVTGLDGKVLTDAKGKPVSVKFPADATDLQKQAMLDEKRKSALRDNYVNTLPKEDQALMKLSDTQLQDYVDSGKIDQNRFDTIKNYQKTAESQSKGNQYDVPKGVSSDLATQTWQKYNSMDAKDQKYWLSDKNPPEEASKTITTLLNKERSDGLSEFKPSNALAKAYADYEKDLGSHPEYTAIDQRNKAKAFQTYAYKLNYSQPQQDLYSEGGSSDVKTLISNKQIDKGDLDAAIKMDDELYNSGLTGSLKFSKKFRSEYGYGLPSGGKGGNAGTMGGSSSSTNAHLSSFIPSFSQGTSAGNVPNVSRKTRTTPSFKTVSLPKAPSAPKVNIKL